MLLGKQKRGLGQATVEYVLFAGMAFLIGLLFHYFSTPFAAALFYGDQAQRISYNQPQVSNAGLERAMARPIP